MERLKLDFVQLNKALKTLENSFDVAQKIAAMGNAEFLLAAQDSIIQRFEYSYEGFWKFLKKYLEQMHHFEDLNSPRKVFRASVKAEICTLEEGNTFIDMADSRNGTSHAYSIEVSRFVLSVVPHYYGAMIAVVHRLDAELGSLEKII